MEYQKDMIGSIFAPGVMTGKPRSTAIMEWRPGTELPEVSNRPGRCFVRVQGWQAHSGTTWVRFHCDLVYTSDDNKWGFRQEDIDRIMHDGDMDAIDAITHWMPVTWPNVGD